MSLTEISRLHQHQQNPATSSQKPCIISLPNVMVFTENETQNEQVDAEIGIQHEIQA